jgi:PAS domain S-box-containing protein
MTLKVAMAGEGPERANPVSAVSTDMLLNVLKALGAAHGPDLLERLVRSLGETLLADLVFVGRFDRHGRSVSTVALWSTEPVLSPLSYDLAGTPCEDVTKGRCAVHPSDVSRLFPDDAMLAEFGAEAYGGAPLSGRDGVPIGILVAISRQPFAEPTIVGTLLSAFAGRAAAELEAVEAAEQLSKANLAMSNALTARATTEARMRDFAASSSDWFWEQDADLRFTYVSSGLRARTGIDPAQVIGKTREDLRDAGTIERDAESWASLSAALAAHKPFRDFEYTQRDPGGEPRRFQISGLPVHDRQGRFAGYRGTGRDVTALHDARERAKRSEQRLRDGIEAMPAGFALFDAEDRLVMANSTFRSSIEGYAAAKIEPGIAFEALLRRLADRGAYGDVGTGEALEAFIQRRLAAHRAPGRQPVRMTMADGRHLSVRERRTAEGGTVIVRSDVTDLRRIQRRLVDAIEAVPVGFIMLDAEDRLVHLNRRYRDFYPELAALLESGMGHAEALTARQEQFRDSPDYERRLERLRWRLQQHERADGSAHHMQTPGGRDVMVSETRTADGGIVGVHTDITALVMLQHELGAARQKAEDALAVRTRFLANISHEFRTPLNAVIGFAELMLMETQGPLGERYRDYTRTIKSSGEFLLSLIVDILDMAKIEAGKMTVTSEAVDIGAAAQAVVSMLSLQAEKKGLSLTLEQPSPLPAIPGEERRLRQILQNLVSNAIKFTKSGGITVSLQASGSACTLAVADTGAGMTADDIAFAMVPFQQSRGHDSRELMEGTGLGLPLVKALTELHGGRLEIDSTPGIGTTVRVVLPLAP